MEAFSQSLIANKTKTKNFAGYAFASTMIKIHENKLPERLANMTMTTSYQTSRDSKFIRFYSKAKKGIGTQTVWNRLHHLIDELGREWNNPRTKDQLRVYLKQKFF